MVLVSPDWYLNSTYPLDEGDGDSVPDDAWRTIVLHRAGTSQSTMQAIVICLTGPAPEYVTEDVNSSTSTEVVKTKCPPGSVVVGGGAFIGGAIDQGHLVKSVPYDSKDDGKVPDDGWTAKFSNDDLSSRSYQAIAICR